MSPAGRRGTVKAAWKERSSPMTPSRTSPATVACWEWCTNMTFSTNARPSIRASVSNRSVSA